MTQAKAELFDELAHSKMFSDAFKSARLLLPSLFQGETIPHPSLFEMASSISMHNAALQRCAVRFSEPINAPEFVAQEPHGSDEFLQVTLRGIFDSSIEMPFYYDPHNVLVSPNLIPSLISDLIDWLNSAVTVLESSLVFHRSTFRNGYLLSLVRALGYVYGNNKERFSKDGSLFLRVHNALAAISVHRYCFGVLEKIAADLQFDVSKRDLVIKSLAAGFLKMITGWTLFIETTVPDELKVSLFKIGDPRRLTVTFRLPRWFSAAASKRKCCQMKRGRKSSPQLGIFRGGTPHQEIFPFF